MRHRKTGVKLGRTSSHRDAMFRNMVTSLLKYDRIRTTDVKAKELRRRVDKVITLAKRGDLHARRLVMAIVREKAVVHKLFEEAPKRFGSINGGYSRIVKIGNRPGDAAPMSLIELISADEKSPKAKKKKTRATKAPKKESPAVSQTKPDSQEEKTSTATVDAPEAESQETDSPSEAPAEATAGAGDTDEPETQEAAVVESDQPSDTDEGEASEKK